MILMLLGGCVMGPSVETLIDELRVLAVVAEPPEVGAGDVATFSALTIDPVGDGYDTLTWTCTFAGEACLESLSTKEAWSGLTFTPSPEGAVTSTYAVPEIAKTVLTEEPVPLAQSWTLSCVPGLCPPIEALRDPGSTDTETLRSWLSDPFALVQTLPLEGVSLALRSLRLSSRSPEERGQNPSIVCTTEDAADEASVDDERLYTCDVAGNITELTSVWGYTTGGGWEGARIELEEGDTEVEYRWFAPSEADEVSLWVILTDGEGGVGIWEETLTVR